MRNSFGTVTEYEGISFRSRTEAIWAAHFDEKGIPWRYESITFRSGAARYTPDFFLPSLNAVVEIKAAGNLDLNRWAHLVYSQSKFTTPFCNRPLLWCVGRNLTPSGSKGEYIWVFPPADRWTSGTRRNVRALSLSAALAILEGFYP